MVDIRTSFFDYFIKPDPNNLYEQYKQCVYFLAADFLPLAFPSLCCTKEDLGWVYKARSLKRGANFSHIGRTNTPFGSIDDVGCDHIGFVQAQSQQTK